MVKTDPERAQAHDPALDEPDPALCGPVGARSSPMRRQTMMTALNSRRLDLARGYGPCRHARSCPPVMVSQVPENLFRKITDEERADWQARFAGVRS